MPSRLHPPGRQKGNQLFTGPLFGLLGDAKLLALAETVLKIAIKLVLVAVAFFVALIAALTWKR